jgi:glucose/arabinose dehydrogenase/PKD repeat protein
MKYFFYICLCLLTIVITACKVIPPTPDDDEIVLIGALPAQFEAQTLFNLSQPTGLAFTPDGRLLATSKTGQLYVYSTTLSPGPVLDLSASVCTNSEQGLLSVAVDPEFASNNYIYLYYTYKKFPTCERATANAPVNRVSRFTLNSDNTVNPSSEFILLDNILSFNGNHNGGDLHFGKDGYLYVSMGDGGCDYAGNSGCAASNDAARELHTLLGKILRITNTGSPAAGNPYQGSNTAICKNGATTSNKKCREIFAFGLRNPFRLAFDPNATNTRFFINDVGQNTWEEINLGQAGADYGWNMREGNCVTGSSTTCGPAPSGLTNPIFAYKHDANPSGSPFQNCSAITAGAFVPNGFWPSAYNNTYLFADTICGDIFRLKQTSNGYKAELFADLNRRIIHMTFAPYNGQQALYYTTFNGTDGINGQVRRIIFSGSNNRPPEARVSVTPQSGNLPLTINFNASNSTDPDGDSLSFEWNFGDGNIGTGVTTSHTYTQAGPLRITLTVRDSRGASSALKRWVYPGNNAPVPIITSPGASSRFGVGDIITLQATASDAEDGTLSGSQLSWQVAVVHNTHTHPYVSTTTGNSLTLTMPSPEDLAATENSYLVVYLTATDSQGLSKRLRRNLYPKIVNLNFATNPTGLRLEVNNTVLNAPKTIKSWQGYVLTIKAPNQNTTSGLATFSSWSDGGAASHTITTPSSGTTYTATFSIQ